MASTAQLNANRQNATHSTGPVTETGKSNASRNHLTRGLYTQADYVKPEERELYREFRETMLRELEPATLLEQSLAAEITGATWRLRRCANAEAELADYALTDPLLDESKEKSIRSIERARSAAHSQLHRSINQLRKLQTCREGGDAVSDRVPSIPEPDAPVEATPEAETRSPELASNCNAPRNAPCPCGSGIKFKRCCARKGPAWSHLNDLPTAA
jgi:hypothetical protein